MDSSANNYNSSATCDDGSCTYDTACGPLCSGFSGANFTMNYNWAPPVGPLVNFIGLSPCNSLKFFLGGVQQDLLTNIPTSAVAYSFAAPAPGVVVMIQITDNCNGTYLALASVWPATGGSVSNSGTSS